MPDANFVQIHSLHGYSAALLNRDDSGLAKRMPYGGCTRTRISSQCLKRHWRKANGEHALTAIDGATEATRSREIVSREVVDKLKGAGYDAEIVDAVHDEFQMAVYGGKGTDSRQPLLLGQPEIDYLYEQARALVEGAASVEAATKGAKEWRDGAKGNLKAMREACQLPGGLVAAMFGPHGDFRCRGQHRRGHSRCARFHGARGGDREATTSRRWTTCTVSRMKRAQITSERPS